MTSQVRKSNWPVLINEKKKKKHVSAFDKFRAGVAPLRIDTGRYEGLEKLQRVCPFCKNAAEDEFRVIFDSNLYEELRHELFRSALARNIFFENMTNEDKFTYLFTSPEMVRLSAKTCFLILQRRKIFLCKWYIMLVIHLMPSCTAVCSGPSVLAPEESGWLCGEASK